MPGVPWTHILTKFLWSLTHKRLQIHGCLLSTEATDALVLKHQAISTYRADGTFIALNQIYTEIVQLQGTTWEKLGPGPLNTIV